MLGIATGLADRGMSIDLVLVKAEGEYLSQVPEGVRLIDLDSHRTATSFLKLAGYLRRERPATLLSTLAHANVVALITKLLFGRRLRVIVRMENTFTELFDNGTFRQRQTLRVLKRLLPSADGIVASVAGGRRRPPRHCPHRFPQSNRHSESRGLARPRGEGAGTRRSSLVQR